MNAAQKTILVDYYISSEIMRAAVKEVIINGKTAYKVSNEHDLSRSALSRQVRLMNERVDMVTRCIDAADTIGGF